MCFTSCSSYDDLGTEVVQRLYTLALVLAMFAT